MVGKGGRRKTTWGTRWNHGPTKLIRVPRALESQILKYAICLDSGQSLIDTEELQKAILLSIDSFVETRVVNFHPNQYSRIASTHTRRWDELRKFRQMISTDGLTAQSLSAKVHR